MRLSPVTAIEEPSSFGLVVVVAFWKPEYSCSGGIRSVPRLRHLSYLVQPHITPDSCLEM